MERHEIYKKALELQAERDRLTEDVERERMRLAGCSSAALGYYKRGDSIHEDYKSASLDDVLRLREHADRLAEQVKRLREALMRLSRIPVEDFSWENKPEQQLHAWNGYVLYVSDVLKARAALKDTEPKP